MGNCVAEAEPSINVIFLYTSPMVKQQIKEAVAALLKAKGIADPRVELTPPDDPAHGDLTTNAALAYSKELGVSPRELAGEIVEAIKEVEGVEGVSIAGPGFVNITLDNDVLGDVVKTILKEGEKWGSNDSQKGQTIMVEYTDPNPFKPFHIGHLMPNVIGESLATLADFSGARVIRANYQGDVGMHVAKAVWGMQVLKADPYDITAIGQAYAHGATAYKNDSVAKGEIDIINKKIYERSDEEINALYDTGRKTSLEQFEKIYKRLGTKFDNYFFESEMSSIGKGLVEIHSEFFPLSDGARVFKGEEYGLHTRVFINSQGLPTYEAKELGLQTHKMLLYPDLSQSIVVTGNEINEYFKVLTKALELIDARAAKVLRHISHGMMRFATGKMSSRTGNVITGETLLNDLCAVARVRASESRAEDLEVLADQIGVGAIKYQILRQAMGKDTIYDEARALSLDGDSGPYVQYAHARARSIIAAAHEAGVEPEAAAPVTSEERLVARLLMQFPDVVSRAQESFEPHHVAQYAGELAGLYNSWYAKERVVGDPAAPRRAALTLAVATTLHNALYLLGIKAPEKM